MDNFSNYDSYFDYEDYRLTLNESEQKYAPRELFYEGDTNLLLTGRRVCVVGSRKVTPNGAKRTNKVTNYLCNQGITIVSGLAEGVDTIAHQTAIINDGHTIAVIGTPLDQCYPKSNIALLETIRNNHLVVSQFPVGYPVQPKNFPIRNRTMALVSDATIIIEASEKSGTQHQGWEALRLGRKLYILENVYKEGVSWVTKMLDYGAEIMTKENTELLIEEIPEKLFLEDVIDFL